MQRSITWHEMWSMSPLRLAYVFRSIYDVLPSRDNLQRWGITQDAKCTLCGESQTLRHVLSGCSYALAHGRFTWRRNQVLLVAIEAIKAVCSSANAQESVPQIKAYFLREGASQFARSRCRAKRRHILERANDWKIAADILSLLNQSWLSGRLPSSWKKATVIPIPKKGKPSSAPSSYRPISLTSTLCKLLERVVAGRLRWFLESRNLLNSSQAGFRKGRGCADQIRLVQDVAASSTQKKMTLGVFLDLEKAFDMVWREGIVNQLFQMGIKGRMLHWIHDFLQDRTIQVKVGTAFSRPHHLENGTPQGSALSPLLFIIMMIGMARPIKGVQLSMYADDIALWTTGSKLGDITSRMQKQLNETAKFLFANGFKF